jgi:hypothetical protein
MAFQTADAGGRGKPRIAVSIHRCLGNVIVWEPARTLPVLPLFPVKSNDTVVRGKPNLHVRARGDTRKIVPRQTVLAFVETPAFRGLATNAGFGGEPQAPGRIESNTEHVFNRPGSPEAIPDCDRLPCASVPCDKPIA